MRKSTIAALTAASLLLAGGYYGVADALDLVPGPLTVADSSTQPADFPTLTAPAAGAAPAALGSDAPEPSGEVLAGYAKTLAADSLIPGATVGVSIIDVASGKVLVDENASTPLTPASSNKVPVAWAALTALGPEHRLVTRAVLDGNTVTLVGGGDVLMAADAGNPNATVGHAGLGDLARSAAQALKARGVTSVKVTLDDTLFTGPTWNPEWEQAYANWVAPIQPIMIDVSSHGISNPYPADPAMEAANAFTAALGGAGISVEGSATRAKAASGAATLASVTSAPLADILRVSLKASDNTMTEVEGHILAAETGHEPSFTGAAQAVADQLAKDGLDTTGLSQHDSSGLATSNKVPARLLAQIIAKALGNDAGTAGRSLMTDLPVANVDGTLHDRLAGTSAAGRVRAKTGSLDQSASLTGTVVTKDGRQLAFSIIVDGFAKGALANARAAMDKDLVAPMADCGCQS